MKISQQIVITVSNINEAGELVRENGAHLSVIGIDTESKERQEVRVGVHHSMTSAELSELKNLLNSTLENAIADRKKKEDEEKGPTYTLGGLQHYDNNKN